MNAEHFRAMAQRCRELSRDASTPETKHELLEWVDEFETQAEAAKAQVFDPETERSTMVTISDFRNRHEQEAARLCSLLSRATTPALKTRLLEQIKEQQLLAKELEQLRLEPAE